MLDTGANEFSRLLIEGKLLMQIMLIGTYMKGDRPTHLEDWIIGYEMTLEGRNLYQDWGKDLVNWWNRVQV
ncbi:hypothetical protein OROHE_014918 [Orobanche hederae]